MVSRIEYQTASGIPLQCLIYLVDESAPWLPSDIEKGTGAEKLSVLKANLRQKHTCARFSTPDNLAAGVASDLGRLFSSAEAPSTFVSPLPDIADNVGRARQHQMDKARKQWVASPKRRLLVYGTPGVGKSMFARTLLRQKEVAKYFGNRRFELRCDAIDTFDALLANAARIWFDHGSEKPESLPNFLRNRLAAARCAVLLDNFETLLHSHSGDTNMKTRQWLAEIGGLETVWLIVAVQGLDRPNEMPWKLRLVPEALSLEDGVDLFCSESDKASHADDPRLPGLLNAVDLTPHWIKILAGNARGYHDLAKLQREWDDKGMAGLLKKAGTRDDRMELGYKFAIECLSQEVAQAFRVLAWLPAGLAEQDAAAVLPGREGDVAALHNAALIEREGNPCRLRMVKPLRGYADLHYRPESRKLLPAIDHFLAIPSAIADPDAPITGDQVSRIAAEIPNILAAAHAALTNKGPAISKTARGLVRFSARTGQGHSEVLELLGRLCTHCRAERDPTGEAWSLWGLGEVERSRNRYQEAGKHYKDALPLFREAQNKSGEASCLCGLGEVERSRNRYPEAERHYKDALSLFREAQNKSGEASCLWGLGNVERSRNRYSEAETYYNDAILLFREARDKFGEALCLLGLGQVERFRNRYPEAERHYKDALPLFRDALDKSGEASCLWGPGEVERLSNRHPEAERHYKDALPLFRDAQNKSGAASCLWGLGNVERFRNRYPEAETRYNNALSLFRDAQNKSGEGLCLESLGGL